jgi:hypothetical protein
LDQDQKLGLNQSKHEPDESRNVKSKMFQMGILKVAIVGMLGTLLAVPFAASAGLVHEGRLEGAAASALAAGNARALKDESFSAPAGGADQADPATPQDDVFPAAFSKIGTILAVALLVLPFGLSTLRILHRNRAA